MRFLLKTFFTLATLVVLLLGAATFLVPRDLIRDQAVQLVKQQTGRDLTIGGETSFAFYPSLGVEMEDVALSGPPGMAGGPLLRIGSLTLSLKLLPLLTRSVEVERFVLERPIFDLRVDGQGRRNWDFSRKNAAAGPRGRTIPGVAASTTPTFARAQAGGLGAGAVQNIRLGTVRIIDGVVLYADAKKGTSQRLDAVNVALTQGDLDAPLNAEGDLVWKREKVAFKGQMGSPTALTRGGPTAVSFSATSKLGKTGFNGRAVLGDAFSAGGDLTGETPSVRDLTDWAGNPLGPGKGFGPATLKGHIGYEREVLTFTKTKLTLDGMNGQGRGSVSLKGAKPYIRAAFAVDRLDLNAYVGPGGAPHRARARTLPPPEKVKPAGN
ncbi:MAG: AsmA family protein, partial [Hyphomicrobiales bacterium]|nr:AsmA family protein [Hyphomicrobiales bacterium]